MEVLGSFGETTRTHHPAPDLVWVHKPLTQSEDGLCSSTTNEPFLVRVELLGRGGVGGGVCLVVYSTPQLDLQLSQQPKQTQSNKQMHQSLFELNQTIWVKWTVCLSLIIKLMLYIWLCFLCCRRLKRGSRRPAAPQERVSPDGRASGSSPTENWSGRANKCCSFTESYYWIKTHAVSDVLSSEASVQSTHHMSSVELPRVHNMIHIWGKPDRDTSLFRVLQMTLRYSFSDWKHTDRPPDSR